MRFVPALAAALPLATLSLASLAAQEPLEILRQTAATYKDAKSYKLEGTDTLERSARGKQSTTRRPFHASRLDAGMRVDFADGGIRLTDGHFEWNYNTQTRQYTKKPVPWDSRGRRSFNEFFYNYESIADFVHDAGFLGPPGKDGFLIEVNYLLPGDIAEVRTYWIDRERYVVLREISSPATIGEIGPVRLTRTVNFQDVVLGPKLEPSLFAPPSDPAPLSGAAPDFALADLAGGQVALKDLRGKAVLLYFWATWCATCRAEMAKIEEVARACRDRGLVVLGINDEEPEIATAYLAGNGHGIRSLVDRWQDVYRKYAVTSIPTVILIARDGRIVSVSGYGEEAALHSGLQQEGLE